MTENLTILSEIDTACAGMSDIDIRRAERVLVAIQNDEKALGRLHNESLKKLWSLSHHYDIQGKLAAISVQQADNAEAAMVAGHQLERSNELEHVCQELFWIQVKDEIGASAREVEVGLGIREGWMVVSTGRASVVGRSLASVLARLTGQ